MTAQRGWPTSREEFGAPTEGELRELGAKTSPSASEMLKAAATDLIFTKLRTRDVTPWRDLVSMVRAESLISITVNVIDEDGNRRLQPVSVDTRYGSPARDLSKEMFGSALRFSKVLQIIEKEREQNRKNGRTGGRPPLESVTTESIAAWLKNRGYADSLNKKQLVIDAMEQFGVKRTKVTDAITKHGLAQPKAPRTSGKSS